jgi:hypothetical protein
VNGSSLTLALFVGDNEGPSSTLTQEDLMVIKKSIRRATHDKIKPRETETEAETEAETERDRERESERAREGERGRERERDREGETERESK